MVSTEKVRNLVLFFMSKDGRGYLTPAEYNSFSELAQRSLYESLMVHYNRLIIRENNRMTNSEYADLPKQLRERVDYYASYANLERPQAPKYGGEWVIPSNVDDVCKVVGLTLNNMTDIEEVSKLAINKLNSTSLISASRTYPVYARVGKSFIVYPDLVAQPPDNDGVQLLYLRLPVPPKWTYTVVGGDPLFNPASNLGFADFDMHESFFEDLVVKILSYAGVSINSSEVVQYAEAQEGKRERDTVQ